MDKNVLRKEMERKRDELSKELFTSYSNEIFTNIEATKGYKDADYLFVFVSFRSEVFTHDFIKNSIKMGKKVCIPHIIKDEMYPVLLEDFNDLKLGYYNILSMPEDKINVVDSKLIDLTIVPGLIFDKNLYRIGYGGGFYDKFLSRKNVNPIKFGVCFDFQIVEDLKPEAHDIPVDILFTQHSIIERK